MNRVSPIRWILFGTIVFSAGFLAFPLTSIGWEEDFHYGLTAWLATKAGFSESDAHLIADGTLKLDRGINDARHLVGWYACAGNDTEASERVRDTHFPSFTRMPAEPEQRKVVADSEAAQRDSLKEMCVNVTPQSREYALDKFGQSLHPLQDSWSHQGKPSIPLACKTNLAWGHPQNPTWKVTWFDNIFGGVEVGSNYWNHNADLTYVHPTDTVAAAKTTYLSLLKYRANLYGSQLNDEWSLLERDVQMFASAQTKADKRAWFKGKHKDLAFLDKINLPNGIASTTNANYGTHNLLVEKILLPSGIILVRQDGSSNGHCSCFREWFEGFLNSWLQSEKPGKLVDEFVDIEAMKQSIAQELSVELGSKLNY